MYFLILQLAQSSLGTIGKPTSSIIKGTAKGSIESAVSIFIALATTLGGIIFLVMLVMGGLQWLTSGGDKAALEGAKSRITNAAIGLVLIVGALAITFVIQTALGINILDFQLPGGNGSSPTGGVDS